ncbi:MAG: hypothetical protein QXW79_01575 [Thermoplasmata archaeon]
MYNGYSNVHRMIPYAFFDDAFKHSPHMKDFQKRMEKNNPLYSSHDLVNDVNLPKKDQMNNTYEISESTIQSLHASKKDEVPPGYNVGTTQGNVVPTVYNVSKGTNALTDYRDNINRGYYELGRDFLPLIIPEKNSSIWGTIILLFLVAIVIYGLYSMYKKSTRKIEITECPSSSSYESSEKSLLIKNLERLIKQK